VSTDVAPTAGSSGRIAPGPADGTDATAERPPRLRMLYIYPDTVGFHADPAKNPLHYLSRYFEGDFVAVWIVQDEVTARERAPAIERASGSFRFHWRVRGGTSGLTQRLAQLAFQVRTARRMSRLHGRYDVIIAHGPFSVALSGMILRAFTGAPLIVEFPGHPFRGFDHVTGFMNRLKRRLAPVWARFVVRHADHLRLLYPAQLEDLGAETEGRTSVFHEFTTVASATAGTTSDSSGHPYILFVGYPYYLKGVDVLIRAFQRISSEFPQHRLIIVGHCPEPAEWRALAGADPRIIMHDALPHDEAMTLMAQCAAFVLPSRTEAMGRVLLEAMAFGRPVIASAVGGIPHYVTHEETGLLFEGEDDEQLAGMLARVLRDPAFAHDLGERGRRDVLARLSEEHYAQYFHDMVVRTLAARAPDAG
jgi:glycosyltransferase involved in cell wall biosynthesis